MDFPKLLTVVIAVIALAVVGVVGYVVLRPPTALLSNAAFEMALISPNADGVDDLTTITYSLARPAQVSITLENESGDRYTFRDNERRTSGDYSVLFSGIVGGYTLDGEDIPGDIQTRLIPNGSYTWVIDAHNDDDSASATGTLDVVDADSRPPVISSFSINPGIFTPNQDGISDRVDINVYLEKAADLSVYLEDNAGQRYYLDEIEQGREPGDMGNHEFDYDGGVDQGMEPPADGVYTVYAVAQDAEGQRIMRQGTLEIQDGGLPQVEIVAQTTGTDVYFETQPYDEAMHTTADETGAMIPMPEGVMSDLTTLEVVQGDLLVFKLTVWNYGDTPIRTIGPFPGTVYDFDQQYSTIGAYVEPGAWRVGINCDTALSDFPWRWAIAPKDQLEAVYDETQDATYYYLLPGARAEVWGAVRLTELVPAVNPQDCWAGLIHERVETLQTRVGAREVKIAPGPGSAN
ncbi:MAG TPA: hypothetical protein PKD09_00315 [Aggregatilinea sp.]|uniref:hypothetical protein n=1 Tax=Aggregatilinea sp. TaxID=2806333 RepID=UPI002D1DF584|nr:hypothetical protein [Aggregatilinea sp.]HML20058.1 hypothetical protein [Aggregatilinea sp.]